MPEIYNLDDGVSEYIEFIACDFKYRFKQLNGAETEAMQELIVAGDEKATQKYLFKFIEKVDETSPDFEETSKKMIKRQWNNFRRMLESINEQ